MHFLVQLFSFHFFIFLLMFSFLRCSASPMIVIQLSEFRFGIGLKKFCGIKSFNTSFLSTQVLLNALHNLVRLKILSDAACYNIYLKLVRLDTRLTVQSVSLLVYYWNSIVQTVKHVHI